MKLLRRLFDLRNVFDPPFEGDHVIGHYSGIDVPVSVVPDRQWRDIEPVVASLWHSDTLNREAPTEHGEGRVLVEHPQDANLSGSATPDMQGHHVLLDIDLPARLVPSSTPDHAHLYVKLKRPVTWDEYAVFLDACAAIGLLDRRYVEHSKRRKMTMCRLPFIPKVVQKWRGGLAGGYDAE